MLSPSLRPPWEGHAPAGLFPEEGTYEAEPLQPARWAWWTAWHHAEGRTTGESASRPPPSSLHALVAQWNPSVPSIPWFPGSVTSQPASSLLCQLQASEAQGLSWEWWVGVIFMNLKGKCLHLSLDTFSLCCRQQMPPLTYLDPTVSLSGSQPHTWAGWPIGLLRLQKPYPWTMFIFLVQVEVL